MGVNTNRCGIDILHLEGIWCFFQKLQPASEHNIRVQSNTAPEKKRLDGPAGRKDYTKDRMAQMSIAA